MNSVERVTRVSMDPDFHQVDQMLFAMNDVTLIDDDVKRLIDNYELAPRSYGGVTVATKGADRYFYDGFTEDQRKILPPHNQDFPYYYMDNRVKVKAYPRQNPEPNKLPHDTSKSKITRRLAALAVGAATDGAANLSTLFHHYGADASKELKIVGVLASLVTAGTTLYEARKHKTKDLVRNTNKTLEHIIQSTTTEGTGAIRITNMLDLPGHFEFMSYGHAPENKIYKAAVSSRYSVDVFIGILKNSKDPSALWSGGLEGQARKISEHQAILIASQAEIDIERQRAQFTGIKDELRLKELTQEVIKQKEDIKCALQESAKISVEQEAKQERIASLDALAVTPWNEVESDSADSLKAFRNIIFRAAMDVKEITPDVEEALKKAAEYVNNMTALYTSAQSQRFYNGLVNQIGGVLVLPSWNEVEDDFLLAN